MTRLTLVGYRASGKSTLGRLAAARLAWPFIDLDAEVERDLGMPIARCFAERGEAAFRDAEAAALARVLAAPGAMVVATGGGVVLRPGNRAILRAQGGTVVYLCPELSAIQERLTRHAGGRPSLTGAPVAEEAARLLAERDPLYREVATHVLVPAPGADATADRLVALIA